MSRHVLARAALALLCLLASGCASLRGDRSPPPAATASAEPEPLIVTPYVVGYDAYRDPLIWFNRAMFAFNDKAYRYVLIPLSARYMRHVPQPARQGINNFFHNLKTPIFLVNHLLQGDFKRAGRNVASFCLNSTVGVAGLFDPALHWYGLPRETTDFDDTLTTYGVGYGIYLVLPFFGSADTRKGTGMIVDYFLHPVPHLTGEPATFLIRSGDFFQEYAPDAPYYERLWREAEDPYTFYRNLYLQRIMRDEEYR